MCRRSIWFAMAKINLFLLVRYQLIELKINNVIKCDRNSCHFIGWRQSIFGDNNWPCNLWVWAEKINSEFQKLSEMKICCWFWSKKKRRINNTRWQVERHHSLGWFNIIILFPRQMKILFSSSFFCSSATSQFSSDETFQQQRIINQDANNSYIFFVRFWRSSSSSYFCVLFSISGKKCRTNKWHFSVSSLKYANVSSAFISNQIQFFGFFSIALMEALKANAESIRFFILSKMSG